MSDCNHETIKCMKCHRYVGINEQVIPIAPAVARIKELEEQVAILSAKLNYMESTADPHKGYKYNSKVEGLQHECT